MAYTDQDRRFFKNQFNSLKTCSNKTVSDTNMLLEQILTAIEGKKDYEVVCISNDGGQTIVKGVVYYPEGNIELNGIDVTGTYEIVQCDLDNKDGYTVYDEGCFQTPDGIIELKGFQVRSFETNLITYAEYNVLDSSDPNYTVGTMITDITSFQRIKCLCTNC